MLIENHYNIFGRKEIFQLFSKEDKWIIKWAMKKSLYLKFIIAIASTVVLEVIYLIINVVIYMIIDYKISGLSDKIIIGLIVGFSVLFAEYLVKKKNIE